jgi:hypothetical protein
MALLHFISPCQGKGNGPPHSGVWCEREILRRRCLRLGVNESDVIRERESRAGRAGEISNKKYDQRDKARRRQYLFQIIRLRKIGTRQSAHDRKTDSAPSSRHTSTETI